MDKSFGPRLRRIRKARKVAMKELAILAGKSEGWVSRLETGQIDEEPSFSAIVKWAALLGVTTQELTGIHAGDLPLPATSERTRQLAEIGEKVMGVVRAYDPPPTEVPFERADSGFRVLAVEDYVPASHAAPEPTQVRDTIRIPEELLEGCQEPHVFYVAGDCLKPEAIKRGDYLIVDGANRSPQDGEVVVARLDGELTMKLYFRLGDRVELRPADAAYETLVAMDGRNQLEIIGVCHAVYSLGKRGRR